MAIINSIQEPYYSEWPSHLCLSTSHILLYSYQSSKPWQRAQLTNNSILSFWAPKCLLQDLIVQPIEYTWQVTGSVTHQSWHLTAHLSINCQLLLWSAISGLDITGKTFLVLLPSVMLRDIPFIAQPMRYCTINHNGCMHIFHIAICVFPYCHMRLSLF